MDLVGAALARTPSANAAVAKVARLSCHRGLSTGEFMKTVGAALDANRGIGPGFDFMRLFLAFGVIGWHSIPITQGSSDALKTEPWWILVYSLVPVFFALSGFLVTGSAMRSGLKVFFANRALRIFPALFVDTAISILLFGAVLTTLPLGEYLTHPETLSYWLNIIGEIHYNLPGVFMDNPGRAVNGSLWTIKPELGCYLIMAILIGTGLVRRWEVVLAALILVWGASLAAQQVPGDFPGRFDLAGDVSKLVIFFLAGSLAFHLRHKIPLSPWIAAGVVAFMAVCAAIGPGELWADRLFMLISGPLLTYLMVWLGMQRLPKLPLYSTGDYSYGIYLYGFPIQQVVMQLSGNHNPLANFAMTIVPVTIMAMLSWHVVEKPTLRLRKLIAPTKAKPAAANDAAPGDRNDKERAA